MFQQLRWISSPWGSQEKIQTSNQKECPFSLWLTFVFTLNSSMSFSKRLARLLTQKFCQGEKTHYGGIQLSRPNFRRIFWEIKYLTTPCCHSTLSILSFRPSVISGGDFEWSNPITRILLNDISGLMDERSQRYDTARSVGCYANISGC